MNSALCDELAFCLKSAISAWHFDEELSEAWAGRAGKAIEDYKQLKREQNNTFVRRCKKCKMLVSESQYYEIQQRFPESIQDLGYCLACATSVAMDIERESDQDSDDDLRQSFTLNNPPQDEGDR